VPGRTSSIHVVHVAAEASPYAKTGGLGDVVGALPAALARSGVEVTVVIPGYRAAREVAGSTRRLGTVSALVSSRREEANVDAVNDAAVPTLLIDAPRYFDRPEIYGEGGRDYLDNAERFVFFCRATLEWLGRTTPPPDVVHVHDWQAALVPVFLADRTRYPELGGTHTITTIHNLAYQGRFWEADWHLLNLDRGFFTPEALEFHGYINFLKGGIVFADAITTVSPRYADEIRTPAFGEGLDGVLRARAAAVVGILNGVDYATWNPATDGAIAAQYDRNDLTGKARCKSALQRELGLDVRKGAPLFAVISRLAEQKGIDLVVDVARDLLDTSDAQLAVLGSGDPRLETALLGLRDRAPRRMAVRLGFDDALAHRIEAGADVFLMPSRYEPCGLSQLYSLRYGTVPVVHATGGLADTVVDYDPVADTGTGFVFRSFGKAAFLDAIGRALALRRDATRWKALVLRGMAADFSWDASAARYRALYEDLLACPVRTA
jgi:starch synthase